MPEGFDAYYKWLGIPPHEQPPNYYRLLGIALFESDHDVISNAADQRMAHVRTFQTGSHALLSQRILNEIAAARVTLLDPQKKTAYDQQLWAFLAGAPKKVADGAASHDVPLSTVVDRGGPGQSPASGAPQVRPPTGFAQPLPPPQTWPAPPKDHSVAASAVAAAPTPPSPSHVRQIAEHAPCAAAEVVGRAEQEVRAARAVLVEALRHKRRLNLRLLLWHLKIVHAHVLLNARKWAQLMPLERQGSLLIGVCLGAATAIVAAISLWFGGLLLIAAGFAGACIAAPLMVHVLYVPRDQWLVQSLTASRQQTDALRAELQRVALHCAQETQAYRQAVARYQEVKKQLNARDRLRRAAS